jgi:uncharacterized protein (TIGR02145 family)
MKNVIKKQCKKFPAWGIKGLLLAALTAYGVVAHAQGAEVCTGTAYTIASTVDASGASTYQWLENGQLLSGASLPTYTVPNTKVAGLYTYVRQAKSADCSEWQSSNEFVVTVFNCAFSAGDKTSATATFVDPRDGKRYKTVVMPDGKTWFAQNLNYTKDLTYNAYSYEANGAPFTSIANGVPAIGSYWCPPQYWVNGAAIVPVASGTEAACNTYGALYTWETAMMVDGKYADESKTNSAWDESWVSGNYFSPGAPGTTVNADKNNARGGTTIKGGGRGICPMGWHVPTDLEWATLLDKVEGDGSGTTFTDQPATGWWGADAGIKLKSSGTYANNSTTSDPGNGSWLDYAKRGSDESGFGAAPAGRRYNDGAKIDARGTAAVYWSATVVRRENALFRQLYSNHGDVGRSNGSRSYGISVRCVKD